LKRRGAVPKAKNDHCPCADTICTGPSDPLCLFQLFRYLYNSQVDLTYSRFWTLSTKASLTFAQRSEIPLRKTLPNYSTRRSECRRLTVVADPGLVVNTEKRYLVFEKDLGTGELESTFDNECGLNQPNPGQEFSRKKSVYEALGSEAFKKVLKPAGWLYKRSTPNDLQNSYIFYIGPEKTKSAVDQLEEGITKFTGYEAIGKQYKEDGKNALKIIRRANEAISKAASNATQRIAGPPRASRAAGTAGEPAGINSPLSTITVDLNQQVSPKTTLQSRIRTIEEICGFTIPTGTISLIPRVSALENEIFETENPTSSGLKGRVEYLEKTVGIKKA